MHETPRAEKVRLAMLALHRRGQQPTAGKIQKELGETVKNGGDLNGRDTEVFRTMMPRLGYIQDGPGKRWHR